MAVAYLVLLMNSKRDLVWYSEKGTFHFFIHCRTVEKNQWKAKYRTLLVRQRCH